MGNSSSNNFGEGSQDIFKEYNQIRKEFNGVVLSHRQTNETYFLRESNYINRKDYQRELQRIDTEAKKEENQNIIKVIKYWGKEYNNFCSNSYKVYTVFDYPEITLGDEITARKKEQRYFQQCDLWSILQSCSNALADLKSTISLTPSKVYIQVDGLLKIVHADMTDDEYRCVVDQKVYYAPQKINQFNKPDRPSGFQKEAIFSMGMTILNAALLEELYDCYDYKNLLFNENKFECYVESLNQRYSESFVEVIATILQPNPNRRPSLIGVQDVLNAKWSTQEDIENQQENDNKQGEADELKQSHTVDIASYQKFPETNYQTNEYNSNRQSLAPLAEVKNQMPRCDNYATRFSYDPTVVSSYATYIPPYPPSKENLFTDPKLLQMIRKDLYEINNMKKAPIFAETSNFAVNNSVTVNYVRNDCTTNSVSSLQRNTSIVESKTNFNQPLIEDSRKKLESQIQGNKNSNRSMQGNQNEQKSNNGSTNLIKSLSGRFEASSRGRELEEMQNESVLTSKQQENRVTGSFSKNHSRNKEAVHTVQEYEDGRYFEGMMLDGVKEGMGRMVYEEGSYYQGEFRNDMMNGYGVLYYEEGRPAYEGNWLDDQFNGKGALYNQNPIQLQGQFDYSDFNAVEQYWIKYQGDFLLDNKYGKGTLVLSNGEEFTGTFAKDSINGQGEFINIHGQTVVGVWADNILTELSN